MGKPGDGDLEYGDAACCRVGWNWPACTATVVAPAVCGLAFVVIGRAGEGALCAGVDVVFGVDVDVEYDDCAVLVAAFEVVVAAFCIAE